MKKRIFKRIGLGVYGFSLLFISSCGSETNSNLSSISSTLQESFSIIASSDIFYLKESKPIEISLSSESAIDPEKAKKIQYSISDNTCGGSLTSNGEKVLFSANKIGSAVICATIGDIRSNNSLEIKTLNSDSSISNLLSQTLDIDGGVVFGQEYDIGILKDDASKYSIKGAEGILKINEDGKLEVFGFGQGKIQLIKSDLEIFNGRYTVFNSILATKIKLDLISQGRIQNKSDLVPNTLLSYITSLDLSGELINDENASDGIKYLGNLDSLDLSENNITDIGFISNLSKLKNLNLSHNSLTDVSSLVENDGLENLDLSDNSISKITKLQYLYKIKHLDLSNNSISDISPLSSSYSLVSLILNGNRIMNFKDSLSGLDNLEELGIGNCGVPFNDIVSLEYLSNLTYLDVSGTDSSLKNIKPLKKLKTLVLSNCQLNKKDISLLNSLTNLEYLDISENSLDSETYGNKLDSIQLSKLSTLKIGGNSFLTIPNLSGFSSLKTLDLTNSFNLQNITSVDSLNINTLILDHCDSIDVGNDGNSFIESIEKMASVKKLSIVGGFNFVTKSIFETLCSKVCDGDFELRFLNDKFVDKDTISNFSSSVFFSFDEFKSVVSEISNDKYLVSSIGEKKQIILSLVNDSSFDTSKAILLKFDKSLFRFDIFCNKYKTYNLAFEIGDRKESSFTLSLNSLHDSCSSNSPVISSYVGSKLNLYNYGISTISTLAHYPAISAYNFMIPFYTNDSGNLLTLHGGSGNNGINGQENWSTSKEPRNGSNGEDGNPAIKCNSVFIDSQMLELYGGRGGNGGNGANAPGTIGGNWQGGDGGDGGDGGVCIKYSQDAYVNSKVTMVGGEGGNGGSAGAKGGLWNPDGTPGSKGKKPTTLITHN